VIRAAIALFALTLCLPGLARAQSGHDYFAVVDLDRDGRISLSEYQERFSYAFRKMDRNRDGIVDESEQLIAGTPRMSLAQLHAQLAEQFRRQDKNHDGGLSPREFLAPPA
jgi:Ca2+-binding EF-hand superfamily protein